MKVTEIEVCEIPAVNDVIVESAKQETISSEAKPESIVPKEKDNEVKPIAKSSIAKEERPLEKKESVVKAQPKKKKKVTFGREEWSGYSYDELRLQLLLTRTRIELNKSMVLEHGQSLMQRKSRPVSLIGRMLGALDYLDYGVLAFKLGRTIFKLFRR